MQPANEYRERKKKRGGGQREWGITNGSRLLGEKISRGGGGYLALTYRKGSGVRPAQLIHRPIDT